MRTQKMKLYLDDLRTPSDVKNWQVVRSYDELVAHIKLNGLENYELISLDHDLGDSAMKEYYDNVSPNYTLDYSHITEKTGMGYINNYLMNCHLPQTCVRVKIEHTIDK